MNAHKSIEERIKSAQDYLREQTDFIPDVGLVLGSGLGDYAEKIEQPVYIGYRNIPDFPVSTAQGHVGRFVLGHCNGKKVMAMQGRFHAYEGYLPQEVTMPIRLMASLGVKQIVLTNAAGGVNTNFQNGTLMAIADHINFSFDNPLKGKNLEDYGVRFPDMGNAYDRGLREKLLLAAKENGIALEQGVYMAFSGPSYETPAEIRMARTLGADAVGMSTVSEAIVAAHCSMKTVGISCITNMAAGVTDAVLTHQDVIETTERVRGKFTDVIDLLLSKVL